MKKYTTSNQLEIPALGLGTWKLVDDQAHEVVREAIDVGYRHIDCARIYNNEQLVGRALHEAFSEGGVSRDDLWVTSKLWNDCHQAVHVRPALEQTLRDLQLDYLDLYLIHWPVALRHGRLVPESGADFVSLDEVPLLETWQAMEACLQSGLCRSIGVSNFSQKKLQHLLDAGSVPPMMNQVEAHPLLQQKQLVEFCRRHEILLTGYSPLGSADRPERLRKEGDPLLLENSQVVSIAEKHEITPAQVLLCWALQRGTLAIPKSSSRNRLVENLAAAQMRLDASDMSQLEDMDQHYRIIDGNFWAVPGSGYTVADLWDE